LEGIENVRKFFIYEWLSREIDDKRMPICSICIFAASLFGNGDLATQIASFDILNKCWVRIGFI